ncbi:MAG TPA: DNA repair protein RecN [Kineosporiaceae bacterium]|nr:DNA repair protein RecN [Kineosporiaceae bacterium]
MLLEMRLRGLGVIADAVLELGPGLTVVTGETGAGKTMVVTGLGLLMGGRSDVGTVREGERSAQVEGRIVVDPAGPVAARALEAGAELDDGDVLIVSRSVAAEGRGRTFVGGRSVPAGLLAELAEGLVTVHGQTDQLRLRSPARQREALDRFAGAAVADVLASYRAVWQRLRHVEGRLEEIVARARERAQEAELLRIGLAEVERVQPQPGEDLALRAESERLGHAEELRLAAEQAHLALTGDPDDGAAADVAALVGRARRALDQVSGHDPALAALADRLGEIGYLVADVAAECASYADGVEADPVRLAAVEERRAVLAALARAHGGDVDSVLAWAAEASPRLLELDGDEDRTAELREQREQLRAELGRAAADLSGRRAAAAAELGEAVSAELADLSMPDARLVVEVRQHEDAEGLAVDLGAGAVLLAAGPDGVDDVEFLLVPHSGAPARPIAKGASGGELSRLMLGLEVVLGAADPVPTFVFDEVDAGVGGRAALGIGRRLARLARTSQVLVVTHLPQVAAYADRHLTVVKSRDGEVTVSGVTTLDEPGRVRELARMLGGMEDSGTAQAHARELLAAAEAERGTAAAAPGRGPHGGAARARRGSPGDRSVRPSTGEDAADPAPSRP